MGAFRSVRRPQLPLAVVLLCLVSACCGREAPVHEEAAEDDPHAAAEALRSKIDALQLVKEDAELQIAQLADELGMLDARSSAGHRKLLLASKILFEGQQLTCFDKCANLEHHSWLQIQLDLLPKGAHLRCGNNATHLCERLTRCRHNFAKDMVIKYAGAPMPRMPVADTSVDEATAMDNCHAACETLTDEEWLQVQSAIERIHRNARTNPVYCEDDLEFMCEQMLLCTYIAQTPTGLQAPPAGHTHCSE